MFYFSRREKPSLTFTSGTTPGHHTARVENAGLENAGPLCRVKNARTENVEMKNMDSLT